jgi:hypothetical protein
MEGLLNWLREEREVLKRAPVVFVVLLVFGVILGGGAATWISQNQIGSLQAAASAAANERDLWRDKYVDLISAKPAPAKPPTPAQPPSRYEMDVGRSLALAAVIVAVVLLALIFVPLPGKGKAKTKTEEAVAASDHQALFDRWRLVDPLSLCQAACLWNEERPPDSNEWLTGDARARYAVLHQGMYAGTLKPYEAADATNVSPASRVSRADLKRFFEAKGRERPGFLFSVEEALPLAPVVAEAAPDPPDVITAKNTLANFVIGELNPLIEFVLATIRLEAELYRTIDAFSPQADFAWKGVFAATTGVEPLTLFDSPTEVRNAPLHKLENIVHLAVSKYCGAASILCVGIESHEQTSKSPNLDPYYHEFYIWTAKHKALTESLRRLGSDVHYPMLRGIFRNNATLLGEARDEFLEKTAIQYEEEYLGMFRKKT